MAPRLIRRRPLAERIKAYLDPVDFLLWLSEEMDSGDWDKWQGDWATIVGLSANFVFLIARANVGYGSQTTDDVFGDRVVQSSWWTWPTTFLVHLLTILSLINAVYTFYRQRHYRLFENPIQNIPSTPSAQRVRVDSSPVASSPLRFLSSMLKTETAESRAHPDSTRDVWEIAVWDPSPLCLRLFCLFSPGHVLVYWLFLPVALDNPRPSVTIVTTLVLAALLSLQLLFLQASFSQQSKDSSIIHKEVMNEYDTKYVVPLSQPLMRDVSTQVSTASSSSSSHHKGQQSGVTDDDVSVDTYQPAFVINRGFRTRPNQNYAKHFDPDGVSVQLTPQRTSNAIRTPPTLQASYPSGADMSSPMRPPSTIRQPYQYRNSGVSTDGTGDGGSLGVYSHANSPLKKSSSSGRLPAATSNATMARRETAGQTARGSISPRKSTSVLSPLTNEQRFGHYLKENQTRRASGRF